METTVAEDVWDDTLVMKTWEESMRLAKEDVAKRIASSTNKDPSSAGKVDTSAGERKLDWTPVSHTLKAGDFCRATYRQDGVDYEAVIVSVDKGERCLIKFLGYGNEQYSSMKDLVASWGEEFRMDQIDAATQETGIGESTEDMDSNASTLNSDRETTPQEAAEERPRRGSKKRKYKNHPGPTMPPMPPTGDETLHAMLMAWYMSGYHTGVYDAQQKMKKK